MNADDIRKLTQMGFPVPNDFVKDEYILIEGETMKEIFEQSIQAGMDGKRPVVIIEARPIRGKERTMRAHYTENQMYLKRLEMMERKIHIFREAKP